MVDSADTAAPVTPDGDVPAQAHHDADEGQSPDVKKKKKKKNPRPKPENDSDDALRKLGSKRGVETLFRTSYRVNMDLTALADTKANIMISINGLIISILISQIAVNIDDPLLYFPTIVFVIGCLVSLIFAVLAARPRVSGQQVTLDDIRQKKSNLLFFGNFAHLSSPDFVTAIKERIDDPVDIYTMMLADIHGVGSVLQRKYRMISVSYASFMLALVLGVASYVGVVSYASTIDRTVVYQPVPLGTTAPPGSGPAVPLTP